LQDRLLLLLLLLQTSPCIAGHLLLKAIQQCEPFWANMRPQLLQQSSSRLLLLSLLFLLRQLLWRLLEDVLLLLLLRQLLKELLLCMEWPACSRCCCCSCCGTRLLPELLVAHGMARLQPRLLLLQLLWDQTCTPRLCGTHASNVLLLLLLLLLTQPPAVGVITRGDGCASSKL
jgi:hypothetical protein